MTKTIDIARLTGGKIAGEIDISAYYWETRYAWGHIAEVSNNYKVVSRAKISYYNRTWESYRFKTAIHSALYGYVHNVTGIDPLKEICKRDKTPKKSVAAETRRLERVEAYNFAVELYKRLTGIVDETMTYEDIEKMTIRKVI